MATKKKTKKKQQTQSRGPYNRQLTGPTRYVRTRAEVDDAIIAAHPDRTISNAYRDALEAWVKFRAYFAANPPNNPELDRLIGEVVL